MIIADTGYWLALKNKNDAYHKQAIQATCDLNDEPLITTWPVITETCYFLLKEIGNLSQVDFLRSVANRTFYVFELLPEHGNRLSELMIQYADQPMDLADASLVVLAESLGHGKILSVDQKDFGIYRWKNRQPFYNLMSR